MAKTFIREKKIECAGHYREIDLFAATERTAPRTRQKRQEISRPAQRNLNDKNAKRYFVQLAEANFGEDDMAIDLTYFDDFLPGSVEEAMGELHKFLRRLDYRRKKKQLPPLKWLAVTSDISSKNGQPARLHHHLFINGGLDWREVMDCWRRRRKKGEKQGPRIGRINIDALQPDRDFNISGKAYYFGKQGAGKKRWTGSLNLAKPIRLPNNDHRYSKRRIDKLAVAAPEASYGKDIAALPHLDFWRKQYPGWRLVSYEPEWNDFTGWSIYLKMRRE